MAEDREEGVIRLADDQLAALGVALREGAVRVPPPSSPPVDILTGREAMTLRRTISSIIDDELSRRRVLSDEEIRVIAKDVAHTVFERSIRSVEEKVRNFLTEDEIEAIVVRKLRTISLRADEEHVDDTRQALEGLMRGQKRRNDLVLDFVKEIVKALAVLCIGAAGTYFAVKGGGK